MNYIVVLMFSIKKEPTELWHAATSCVYWRWFMLPSPCCNILHRLMLFSVQCCLRDWRSWTFSGGRPCLLITEISQDYLNPQIPCNCAFTNVFQTLPIAHTVFSQSGEPLPVLASEGLSLLRMPFSSWYYHLLTVNLFTCGMFQSVLLSIPQLSQSFVAPVQT